MPAVNNVASANKPGLAIPVLPVTGDRYEAIFVQFAASMQELQDLDEKLFASEDYLAMFAKASQYMESRFDSVFAQRII